MRLSPAAPTGYLGTMHNYRSVRVAVGMSILLFSACSAHRPTLYPNDKYQQVGQEQADPATGARALPIYQTTSYVFNDTEHAKNLFALSELGNIYTRIMNPTQDAIEKRIASLEGGVGALLLSSGMSATFFAIINIAQAGDHVVVSPALYGGTYNLFENTLPKLGIEVSFVEDTADPESWRSASRARSWSATWRRRSWP